MDFTRLVTPNAHPASAPVLTVNKSTNKSSGEMLPGEFLAMIQAGLKQARDAQSAQTAQTTQPSQPDLIKQTEQAAPNAQTLCTLVEPPLDSAEQLETQLKADSELTADQLEPDQQASAEQTPAVQAQTLPALWETLFRQQLDPADAEATQAESAAQTESNESSTEFQPLPAFSWSAGLQAASQIFNQQPNQTTYAVNLAVQASSSQSEITAIPVVQLQTDDVNIPDAQASGTPVDLPFSLANSSTQAAAENIKLSQSWLDQLKNQLAQTLSFQSQPAANQAQVQLLPQLQQELGLDAFEGATTSSDTERLVNEAPTIENSIQPAGGFDFLTGEQAQGQTYTAHGERQEWHAQATHASSAHSTQPAHSEFAERVSLVRQLTDRIQLLHTARQRSIELTLNPASLGKVSLRLQQEAQQMHLQILTELPLAKDLLESQLQQLRQQFQQQGLNLHQIQIEVRPDHQAFQEQSSGRQNSGQQQAQRQGPEFDLIGALSGLSSESPSTTVHNTLDGAAVNTLA